MSFQYQKYIFTYKNYLFFKFFSIHILITQSVKSVYLKQCLDTHFFNIKVMVIGIILIELFCLVLKFHNKQFMFALCIIYHYGVHQAGMIQYTKFNFTFLYILSILLQSSGFKISRLGQVNYTISYPQCSVLIQPNHDINAECFHLKQCVYCLLVTQTRAIYGIPTHFIVFDVVITLCRMITFK